MSEFWKRVEHYRQLGIDPLKWVAGCAVKVDLTSVVYPALNSIKPELEKLGVTVSPRQDADIFPKKGELLTERRVYDTKDPKVDPVDLRRINPTRAISLIQVHQRVGGNAESFAEVLLRVYRKIGEAHLSFAVGKGHSIITAYPDAEFALFDFLVQTNGRSEGYNLANNDTIQLIDPTDDPASEPQVHVALSNAIADLVTLGCYENLQILPVFDAPNEEISRQITNHMESYAKKFGIHINPQEMVGRRKLLIGATVLGEMHKEPPIFHNNLQGDMQILVTRDFGDLAPINVYLACEADPDFLSALQDEGFSLDEARRTKDDIVTLMKWPNLAVGEVINRYLPDSGEKFEPTEHIAVTGDLSGPGIYIFKEMAQLGGVDIALDKVPLKYPEYVLFASRNYLMDNGTAGTNGAVAIVASSNVIDNVSRDLGKHGYEPRVIGKILGRGEGKVYLPKNGRDLLAAKTIQEEFLYR